MLVNNLYIVFARAIGQWLKRCDGFFFCVLEWCCWFSIIEGWFFVYNSVEKRGKEDYGIYVAYFLG